METSRQRLSKLKLDGSELVTNVRVAVDSRATQARADESNTKTLRLERLEAESRADSDKFDEITDKWGSAMDQELPEELYRELLKQKSLCGAVIDEKNRLISELQKEMYRKDDHYVKQLKKQAEDIDLLMERIDEHIKSLNRSYKNELNDIEKAFESERRELLQNSKKKLEHMMQTRQDTELEYMKKRDKYVEEHDFQLDHLRGNDSEEFNQVKIKLETDVQILEQQLQQMKATYQLNQEKLEYNFQVLKKRDEENTITKSQQKRKITRLQDVLNNLKSKAVKQEKQYRDENNSLTDDYKRISEQLEDLQKKGRHFQVTDAKRFYDIWCMNEAQVKMFVKKILEEDRIIHEQQLDVQWQPPAISLDNEGPIISGKDNQTLNSASEAASKIMAVHEGRDRTGSRATSAASKASSTDHLSNHLMRRIMELLSSESNFLMEEKLDELLSPRSEEEKSLIRMDSIFSVLGVERAEDIDKLMPYFIKDSFMQPDTATPSPQGSVALTQQLGMRLIERNDVLKALRRFAEDHHKPVIGQQKQQSMKISAMEERDDSGDSTYWQSFLQLMNDKKESVWKALLSGLDSYSNVLQERSSLLSETQSLRSQNAELQSILHHYINSKVNEDLVIPPTKVLQVISSNNNLTSRHN
ncbi:PREDICTED: dynein regulatory complex protein 1-like [Priapulus caudatus]|uniref:Dynein regulatory complex protein 1-like n=1 Tax=Priapulus caudatus TaxID=37621 RepID=A0ABM1E813_PRICU|nr:PREDICTED: dynein regulatory complex protein 1-like [Priapulus caudatus]